MNSVGMMEERPPYVTFQQRSVERRKPAPPDGDGSVYFVDVDFVIVTPAGTRDVFEKVVEDWFQYLDMMVSQKRYNPRWLQGYREMYKHWKETNEIPLTGWPIKNWPAATPAEVKRMTDARILTVEDASQMNEEAIARVGMGARSLKQRAIDFLEAQQGTGPLVTRMDALFKANEELIRQVGLLTKENERISRELEAYTLRERGIQQPASPHVDTAQEFALPAELDMDKLVKL